ncbi:hypothetical protein SDC9_146390 [bioreactor metagenome]|uniref:Uncharacterized protein n=1 Tax=bioreactor metagenome TaxID=1076179 RepID=A0A645ECZ0_9ZZZZ
MCLHKAGKLSTFFYKCLMHFRNTRIFHLNQSVEIRVLAQDPAHKVKHYTVNRAYKFSGLFDVKIKPVNSRPYSNISKMGKPLHY